MFPRKKEGSLLLAPCPQSSSHPEPDKQRFLLNHQIFLNIIQIFLNIIKIFSNIIQIFLNIIQILFAVEISWPLRRDVAHFCKPCFSLRSQKPCFTLRSQSPFNGFPIRSEVLQKERFYRSGHSVSDLGKPYIKCIWPWQTANHTSNLKKVRLL